MNAQATLATGPVTPCDCCGPDACAPCTVYPSGWRAADVEWQPRPLTWRLIWRAARWPLAFFAASVVLTVLVWGVGFVVTAP